MFDIILDKELIVEEMSRRGFNCSIRPVVKNNIKLTGLVHDTDSDIRPTVYLEHFKDCETLDEICDRIQRSFEVADDNPLCGLSCEAMLSREYVKEHVFPAVQKARGVDNALVTIPLEDFEDLEKYYRVIVSQYDGVASFKISKAHLNTIDATIEEIDEWAMNNLKGDTRFEPLNSVLISMLEASGQEIPQEMFDDLELACPMYILSNTRRVNGASAMLNYDALEELCEIMGTVDLAIIPSSIHEVLVVRWSEVEQNPDYFNEMVTTVNDEQVPLEEVLSDHVYHWSLTK